MSQKTLLARGWPQHYLLMIELIAKVSKNTPKVKMYAINVRDQCCECTAGGV